MLLANWVDRSQHRAPDLGLIHSCASRFQFPRAAAEGRDRQTGDTGTHWANAAQIHAARQAKGCEVNEQRAREILRGYIQPDGSTAR